MVDHPQLFDALPAPVEQALRASIERFGVLVPVVRDQHGGMIDGRHRSRIADKLGVTYRVDTVRVTDDAEAAEIQRTLNADRRHLNDEQLVAIATQMRTEGRSLPQIGEALAHAQGQYEKPVHPQQVKRMLDKATAFTPVKAPEWIVGKDGKTQPANRRPVVVSSRDEAEATKAQQALDDIAEDAPAALTANEAQRLAARSRTPAPVKDPVPARSGRYRCIVIDPPWPMKKIERTERPNQGVTLDYPVLSLEQIADEQIVPVRTHAEDDCHMYLWVTHKYLPAGLELLTAWGFRYQCAMTWRKNVGITPYSWMYDTEHVLFATRGNLPLERLGLRLSFEAPVVGHSVKPDVFYERVLTASPGPRVEMFARRNRDGFEAWGNEVTDAV